VGRLSIARSLRVALLGLALVLAVIAGLGVAGLYSARQHYEDRLAAAYGDWLLAPGWPLTIREIAPGEAVDLGDGVRLEPFKVPHTTESVAYSVARGTRRIVYSGDTGPSPELAQWAHGADLLVLECSLPTAMAIPEHLTPEQCGELAAIATPRQLALTHLYPPVERVDVAGIVRACWTGNVVIARDGWTTTIGD